MKMKSGIILGTILTMLGVVLASAGAFVVFADYYFNGPFNVEHFRHGINPKWLIIMLTSWLSIIAGMILFTMGMAKFKKQGNEPL